MPLIISNQCPYYLLLVVTMGGRPGNKQYLKLIGILNCHLLYGRSITWHNSRSQSPFSAQSFAKKETSPQVMSHGLMKPPQSKAVHFCASWELQRQPTPVGGNAAPPLGKWRPYLLYPQRAGRQLSRQRQGGRQGGVAFTYHRRLPTLRMPQSLSP